MTTLEKFLVKPAVVGGTGYVLSKSLYSSFLGSKWNNTLSFAPGSMLSTLYGGSTEISVPLLAGIAVFTGSIIAEMAHTYVFPHIHFLDKSSDKVSLVLAGGLSGAGMSGVINLANPLAVSELGLPTILLAGFATEVIGDTLYSKFIKKPVEAFLMD